MRPISVLRHTWLCLLTGVLAALLAACGDDGNPPQGDASPPQIDASLIEIDCSWFAGPNCWKDSVAAAYTCVAPDATGTFDAARETCTYADGTTVRFAEPVPGSLENYDWRFDIGPASGGSACMSFAEQEDASGSEVELVTSLGTFREVTTLSDTDGTLRIECPDGVRYQIGVIAALQCELSTLPGNVAVLSTGTVRFNFLGRSSTEGNLISCSDNL